MPDAALDFTACRALVAELVADAGGQRKFAKASGLSQSTLSGFLGGGGLDLANLRVVADHAGLDLDDLLAGRRPASRAVYLPLDRIALRSAENPRQHSGYDEESLEQLANSILQQGLLQRIVVARSGEAAGPAQVIAGERRTRALFWLKGSLPDSLAQRFPYGIPCELRHFETEAEMLAAALAENLDRVDLQPREVTVKLAELQEATGWDAKRIALTVGVHERSAQQHLKIARELPTRDERAWLSYLHGGLDFAAARMLVQARKASETPAPAADLADEQDGDGTASGETNENGSLGETETIEVWRGPVPYLRAEIRLSESGDGWRYGMSWRLRDAGASSPITAAAQPLGGRDAAIQAAAAALGRAFQRRATDATRPREDRRNARSVLHALSKYLGPDDRELAIIPPDPESKRAKQEPEQVDLEELTGSDDEEGDEPVDPETPAPPAPAKETAAEAEATCPVDIELLREFVGDHQTAGLAIAADALLQPLALIAIEPATVPQWRSLAAQASDLDRDIDLRLSLVWAQAVELGLPTGAFATRADRLKALLDLPDYALCDLITAAVAERLGPLDPTGGELLRTLALKVGAPLLEEEDEDPRPAFLKAKSQVQEAQDDA